MAEPILKSSEGQPHTDQPLSVHFLSFRDEFRGHHVQATSAWRHLHDLVQSLTAQVNTLVSIAGQYFGQDFTSIMNSSNKKAHRATSPKRQQAPQVSKSNGVSFYDSKQRAGWQQWTRDAANDPWHTWHQQPESNTWIDSHLILSE